MSEIRRRIVEEARTWIGVPWRHQGRSRLGIDCAGLIIRVGIDLGLTTYDVTAYQRRPDSLAFVEHFRRGGARDKPLTEAQPGDIMIFRDDIYPCHSTIVSEREGVPHIIHAYAKRRKVIEEPLDHEWLAKRAFCFQYGGVD